MGSPIDAGVWPRFMHHSSRRLIWPVWPWEVGGSGTGWAQQDAFQCLAGLYSMSGIGLISHCSFLPPYVPLQRAVPGGEPGGRAASGAFHCVLYCSATALAGGTLRSWAMPEAMLPERPAHLLLTVQHLRGDAGSGGWGFAASPSRSCLRQRCRQRESALGAACLGDQQEAGAGRPPLNPPKRATSPSGST